jgi:hypothetical protein
MLEIQVEEIDWSLSKEQMEALVFGLNYFELSYAPVTLVVKCVNLDHDGDTVDLDEVIELRIANHEDWRRTLWHELAHVKQYVNDELELEKTHAVWKGKLRVREDSHYWYEPWEIEAREMEDELDVAYFKRVAASHATSLQTAKKEEAAKNSWEEDVEEC